MAKFYRYLIYKLYSWGLKKKGDTPIANVIFTLSFIHYAQMFTLYMVLVHFFPWLSIFDRVDKLYMVFFLVVLFGLHYFLLFNKKRWEEYLEEFKDESPQESRRGKILVLAYLIGSILLFFIMMPILFGV